MKKVLLMTYRNICVGDHFMWEGKYMKCLSSENKGFNSDLGHNLWNITAEYISYPFELSSSQVLNSVWIN